ncbi:DNA replication complex GINS protein PSF3 isoform X2 [Numenius arquata]|uniref:DNA replication complex GINS protein PSF3 isoform X2 n=1 Tax=Numenius arquata TaxID=31919 RepID=UPI003D307557
MSEAYFPVDPGLGLEENFLSLDDILMSQEKLPGRAESALPRLAFALGQGAGTRDSIPEGSKLEIPLWLAKGLHDSKRRIISVELPKIYKEAWRTVFSADATVVDLHKMGPYYYGFGSQLLNFDNPENPEIAQTILQNEAVDFFCQPESNRWCHSDQQQPAGAAARNVWRTELL